MRLARYVIFLLAGTLVANGQESAAASPPAPETGIKVTAELLEGSRIVGTPLLHEVKLETSYASLDVPLSQVRAIRMSGTGNIATLQFNNGDAVTGNLSATEIGLKTAFGEVSVPMAVVQSIDVSGGGGFTGMPDGLVLHYIFNAKETDTVTDASGNGNDGRIQGASFSDSRPGGAMSFNGDHQVVIIGNPASLRLQDFTIAMWIKNTSDHEDGQLFGYGNGGYAIMVHTDGVLYLTKMNESHLDSDAQIVDNSFHHVAVTKQGGHIVFYLDGVAKPAPDYDPQFQFDTNAGVGANPTDPGWHGYIGLIGELEVFNRALSSGEVKGIYDAQK